MEAQHGTQITHGARPAAAPPRTAPFHPLAKPAGPLCNLRCSYCFYLEKKDLLDDALRFRMPDDLLERYVRDTIQGQDAAQVFFAWQGGEPAMRGLPFFRRVLELQRRHGDGRTVVNALQTNGTLIDDEWAAFLAGNGFLVGISIDGPPELHDRHRLDASGRPTLERVLAGLEALKRHGADFNTLTAVGSHNQKQPVKVYRFLKEIGARHLQFIPLVERAGKAGGSLAGPPGAGGAAAGEVTRWSVGPVAYGRFLSSVFAEWIRVDVGVVHVQQFDALLAGWLGAGPTVCVSAPRCGRQPVVEHDGSVYACDHYVYPAYRLGNLRERPLGELLDSPAQQAFGDAKSATLPKQCRQCEFLSLCHGGCPKHRFLRTPGGEPGLNYLCAGYREFFRFAAASMDVLAALVRRGRDPAEIMQMVRVQRRR